MFLKNIYLKINNNENSNLVDEYLKYNKNKRDEFMLKFENNEKDYRKINKKGTRQISRYKTRRIKHQ